MNLASVAEHVAAIDRSALRFDAARCLHHTDRYATCQACQGVCPVSAIAPGRPPALDAAACVTCLACLPVCPTGAFSADDAVAPLLECAARVETSPLEVVCQLHPNPALGLSAGATAIRVRGCLAGLGVGALVALAALGAESIVLRADACAQCQWGALFGQLERQVAQAQQLLAPSERCARLTLLIDAAQATTPRPLLDADNPPLSRRDLFRMVVRRGPVLLARAMAENGGATGPRQPARERRRLLKALEACPPPSAAIPTLPAGPGFGLVQVSAACSACGACAKACPTGALEFHRAEAPAAYELCFHAARCNGCEACAHACAAAALQVDPQPSFAAVFDQPSPSVVSSGALVRCARCNTWMAAGLHQTYCPTCEFRHAHPFGARPIPNRAKVQP
jgi:ferredoxin